MSDKFITGIDVGTHYVKIAIARVPQRGHPGKPEIIATGVAESRGLKNGYIVNAADVTRSVKSALSQAEQAAGITIKSAYVAIGSIGLEEMYSHGEIIPARADSEVVTSDLEKVMQDSEDRIVNHIPNRRVLHAIPLRYQIDGTEILGRPQGHKGTRLEVDSLFITTYEQHVNDLMTTIEQAGVAVEEDVIAAPIAASIVMLSNAQKRAGCVLVNIGAETTSMIVYEDNTPLSMKIFPMGANDITNDIALGLRIPLEEAEKLKRGSMSGTTVSKKRLDEIITSRLVTIFSLIDAQLKKIKRDELLPAGVILTGGGASTQLAVDAAKQTLNLPARIATLEIGKGTKLKDASWSIAYGLCMWAASDHSDGHAVGAIKQNRRSWFTWLQQFLP